MLLLKAGLITMGLIVLIIVILNFVVGGKKNDKNTNPYKKIYQKDENNKINKESYEEIKEFTIENRSESAENKDENNILQPNPQNKKSSFDIGEKPKDFDLNKYDKK